MEPWELLHTGRALQTGEPVCAEVSSCGCVAPGGRAGSLRKQTSWSEGWWGRGSRAGEVACSEQVRPSGRLLAFPFTVKQRCPRKGRTCSPRRGRGHPHDSLLPSPFCGSHSAPRACVSPDAQHWTRWVVSALDTTGPTFLFLLQRLNFFLFPNSEEVENKLLWDPRFHPCWLG